MAYNRRNYIQKRKHAVQIANSYYEPGRHDRCYRWVWRKYIRDTFHVDYMTFMRWLREERADTTPPAFSYRTLFD